MGFLKPQQLSQSQFLFFLIHAQIGMAILTLPQKMGEKVGHDGWLSVLLSAVVIQLVAFVYYYITKKFPDLTFYDITIKVFGNGFGKLLNICIILFYLVNCVYHTYQCTAILKLWYYYRTPFFVMAILFVFLGFYILIGDLLTIGQFLTLASSVILIMLLLLFSKVDELNYHYLLPIGEAPIADVLKGLKEGIFSFSGFELFLFLNPFVAADSRKKLHTVSLSIWIVASIYLVTITFVYMYFPNAAKDVVNALIYYIIPTHTTVIDRIEIFFIASWSVLMITSFIAFLYMGCLGISKFRNKKHHNHYAKIICLLIFLGALFFNKLADEHFITLYRTFDMAYSYLILLIIPIFTAIWIYFWDKRRRSEDRV